MNRPSGSRLAYDMGEVVRADVCLGGVCVPEATVQAAAVFAFGLLTLLVLIGLAYVYEAESALDEERERVAAERDAFRRFAARIEGLGADAGAASAAGTDAPVSVRTKPPDSGMGTVTEAYRQTVMDVEHFGEEYDESLATNAAAELSPEVAAALASRGTLTPQLRGALVTQGREAATRRENLLDTIDAEAAALETATERLRSIETEVERLDETGFLPYSYAELQETYERVGDLRGDCEDVIDERQGVHHETHPSANRMDGFDFRQYAYDDLDVNHPVLADAMGLIERIDDVESQVVRSLLRRA